MFIIDYFQVTALLRLEDLLCSIARNHENSEYTKLHSNHLKKN